MGNIIPGIIVVLLLGTIIYSIQKSIKTTGSACTSCSSCPIVINCERENVNENIKEFYKSVQ